MRKPWGIALALAAMAIRGEAHAGDGGVYVPGPGNALTPAEAVGGYELIWNGRDFSGWKTYGRQEPASGFVIAGEGGAAPGENPGSNVIEIANTSNSIGIYTADTSFQDFDWMAEFQVPADRSASSGLLYRYSESISKNAPVSTFDFPVSNGIENPEFSVPIRTSGSIYDLKPLMGSRLGGDGRPNWMRAMGQWNQARIICYRGRMAHYGNGLKLVEDEMGTPDWNTRFQASRFIYYPGFETVHPGSFLLQEHGTRGVKFRNLRVKRLTRDPWGPDSPYLDRASAVRRDAALADTLTFATLLFPVSGTGTKQVSAGPRIRTQSMPAGILIRPGDAAGGRLRDLRGRGFSSGPSAK